MPSGFANHYHNDKGYIKGTRDLAARDDKKHPKKTDIQAAPALTSPS